MVNILDLSLVFAIGASGGWLIEVLYRFLFSRKKLVNPGFLNGPYLPIYGSGSVILFLLCSIEVPWPILVLLFLFSLTLLELITGIVFINHLKIKLWDYSDEWLNYRGLICPKFSLYWALIGIGYCLLVYPLMKEVTGVFSGNISLFFVVGIYYGVMVADIFNTLSLAYKIRAAVTLFNKEQVQKFWIDYRQFKHRINRTLREGNIANPLERFFLSFNNLSHLELDSKLQESLNEKLKDLNRKIKKKGSDLKRRVKRID